MAAREIQIRIFVGDRPFNELTEGERESFRRRCVQRMGETLNGYFGAHPEEYAKIREAV